MPHKFPRTGKWIKPAGRSWAPASLVSVICETSTVPELRQGGHRVDVLAAVHVAAAYRRKGCWTSPIYLKFTSGDGFHDWLEQWASPRRRAYVFTPAVLDCLTLTDWWNRIELRGCQLVRERRADGESPSPLPAVTATAAGSPADKCGESATDPDRYNVQRFPHGNQCEILRYHTRGRSFQWTRHSQYLTATEETVAEAVGFTWPRSPEPACGESHTFRHNADRAFMWLEWYCHLADWWQSIEGGPWGPTAAALSYSFLRRRIRPRSILHHGDERAAELEEDAISGGRRSVWFVGNVGTPRDWEPHRATAPARSTLPDLPCPVVHLDVRSMYPWILSQMTFPVERISFLRRCSVEYARELIQTNGLIAKVLVRSLASEYPYRTKAGTSFPVGQWWTTLAGPELQTALESGEIQAVRRAAVYRLGNPFHCAAQPLLDMRVRYRERGERGWELLAKQLANAMSGRLAPVQWSWVPRPKVPALQQWGCWTIRHWETREVKHYRALAGMVWERLTARACSRPMGAAYAYLTAYGRSLMRGYRQILGPKSVVSQDTDGMWCRADSVRSLAYPDGVETDQPGDLNSTHRTSAGRWWSPQHYWYGDGWVLSGFQRATVDPGTALATMDVSGHCVWNATSTPEPIVWTRGTTRGLPATAGPGTVESDGWVTPPNVWVH